MPNLIHKRVLVGVTGGIAAYKSAELVRRLRAAGAEVRVAMTRHAQAFVTPLTFQALSGQPVHVDLFDAASEAGMDHITLARWPDLILIAPASANFIAKLAHGIADNLLSTVCLASQARLALAPAMNQAMWGNIATQDNIELLDRRGVLRCGPASGDQACGDTGPGRMLEPEHLVTLSADIFATGALAGVNMVVTAGPTYEALDPVRGITNRSSGKMGYAVAIAAAAAGARVTLISGPTALSPPDGVPFISVRSADEMARAVTEHLPCDIFVAAAAVADYRPAETAPRKIKKGNSERLQLDLVKNPDIVATVAHHTPRPFCVGFAAETEDVARNARRKLIQKNLDLVAANAVGEIGSGFESDFNALLLVDHGGDCELPRAPKIQLARQLIAHIAERYHAKHQTEDTRPAHRQ